MFVKTLLRKTVLYTITKKSKYICVKPKSMTKLSVPHVYLNGKPLCLINEQKYLGIILQTDWYDDADIKRQIQAMYIYGVTCWCNNLNTAQLI